MGRRKNKSIEDDEMLEEELPDPRDLNGDGTVSREEHNQYWRDENRSRGTTDTSSSYYYYQNQQLQAQLDEITSAEPYTEEEARADAEAMDAEELRYDLVDSVKRISELKNDIARMRDRRGDTRQYPEPHERRYHELQFDVRIAEARNELDQEETFVDIAIDILREKLKDEYKETRPDLKKKERDALIDDEIDQILSSGDRESYDWSADRASKMPAYEPPRSEEPLPQDRMYAIERKLPKELKTIINNGQFSREEWKFEQLVKDGVLTQEELDHLRSVYAPPPKQPLFERISADFSASGVTYSEAAGEEPAVQLATLKTSNPVREV